jgi:hypothetical protein
MNFPILNSKQKFIIDTLKETLGSEFTEKWLYMRNKHFNNNTPIDYLLSENYSYFEYLLNS